MNTGVRINPILICCALMVLAPGCASVKVSMPGLSKQKEPEIASYSQRVALIDATNALADQPWGNVPDDGLTSIVFGRIGETKRDRALKSYVADLAATKDPIETLHADATAALERAEHVARLGREAFTSISPVPSDIDALEQAIGEVRESRTMFGRACQALKDKGVSEALPVRRDLRAAFTEVISEMGETADMVAARVNAGEAKERMASPVDGYPNGASEPSFD